MSGEKAGTRGERGQFSKGRSGNPKGRPKKAPSAASDSAFDILFDRRVALLDDSERDLTVTEALQHRTLVNALAGTRGAQREILKMIAKREAWFEAARGKAPMKVEWLPMQTDPENADAAMLILGIAVRNPARQTYDKDREQLLVAHWAAQAALRRRRGGSRLTEKEIAEIRRCTEGADGLTWPRGTSA